MSYGSSSFGSAAFGGSSGSSDHILFPHALYTAPGTYEAKASLNVATPYIEIRAIIDSDNEVDFEVFSYNLGEPPQSQGQFGGQSNYIQYIIGAAQFLVLHATLPMDDNFFVVVARPYPRN